MFTPYKRPLVVFGAGVRWSVKEARSFVERAGVPFVLSWPALDMFPSDHPLNVGSFGTHAPRYGNFAVQNADFLLVIGCRLDTRTTGTPASTFAPNAKIVMVDIDKAEIDKLGRAEGIIENARAFLERDVCFTDFSDWRAQIAEWKRRYPVSDEGPYGLIKKLSDYCKPGQVICTDTGCALAWVAQAFKWKEGQRFIHAFNQTPMGYGLPAAIGAHDATGEEVVLVAGDGSLMMSINELASIKDLPIKIVLLNNGGHAMVRQTQREWLGGTYPGTSVEGGLAFPNFVEVARACGIPALTYQDDRDLHWLFKDEGPNFLEVLVEADADVVPKASFGKPIHDQAPYLPREELEAQMDPLYWAMINDGLIREPDAAVG